MGFHIHLWPMAQTLRLTLAGIGDAAERGGHHVAVLEGGGELGALIGVVAQPVEQLGEAPFVGVDAAAPVDGFEAVVVGGRGDLLGFGFGAMVAPEVVVVERLQVCVDRDDAGAGGIEGDGRNVFPVMPAGFDGVAGGFREGAHVIGVGLGGVVGIFAAAMQRILPEGRSAEGHVRCR